MAAQEKQPHSNNVPTPVQAKKKKKKPINGRQSHKLPYHRVNERQDCHAVHHNARRDVVNHRLQNLGNKLKKALQDRRKAAGPVDVCGVVSGLAARGGALKVDTGNHPRNQAGGQVGKDRRHAPRKVGALVNHLGNYLYRPERGRESEVAKR